MNRLFDKGTKLREHIGGMERRIRKSITAYAVMVAKGFLKSGYDVYTEGLFVSACWHEGGVPAILVKGLSADYAKRWRQNTLLQVWDYDEYLEWTPVRHETLRITRLTLHNVDEVARERWMG
jgi:hypothetical protein